MVYNVCVYRVMIWIPFSTERAAGIFTDYIGKRYKNSFQEDLAKAHFYLVLSDRSTDASVIEQELVCVVFERRQASYKIFIY